MTAGEVADLIRMPLSTVYELARRGLIPAHRIGRRWRFVRREIEECCSPAEANRPETTVERYSAALLR
jgi:excisionase family DNA binding protein